MTSSVYRDSEGRTRREQSLKGLGIFGAGEEPLQTIFINDPVAGVTYSLDSRSHTAHKSVPFTFEFRRTGSRASLGVKASGSNSKLDQGAAAAGSMIMTAPLAPPPGARVPPPEVEQFKLRTEGGARTYVFRTKTGPTATK